MSICTGLQKIREVDPGFDIIKVTIDNVTNAYMIYNYAESMKFLNQEVIVSYRQDILDGKIETFINTLTIPTKVATLDREKNFKLYSELKDNNSNICIQDISIGGSADNVVLFCVSTAYKNSDRAVWMELKVRDKIGKIGTLRMFDYSDVADYSGHYVKCNVRRNEYGLSTREVASTVLEFAVNPEIEIARKYIEDYFANDETMKVILESSRLLEYMQEYVAEERGYYMVRAAVELDIVNSLKNDVGDVDYKALEYALLLRYGRLKKKKNITYSDLFVAMNFILNLKMEPQLKDNILHIVDMDAPDAEPIKEKLIFKQVVNMADTIIQVRKEAM